MKKFLLVLAVAGFAVACNNDSDKKKTEDTTVAPVDTTVAPVDTTTTTPVDTTAKTDTVK